MTQSLSAEEIAGLLEARRVAQEALSVSGPLTQRGYEARRAFSDLRYKHEAALLAMASRLVERDEAETYLIDSGLLGRGIVQWAKEAGWPGPTSQAKGG